MDEKKKAGESFPSWDAFLASVRQQLERIFADEDRLADWNAHKVGLLIREDGIGLLRVGDDPDEPGGQYL